MLEWEPSSCLVFVLPLEFGRRLDSMLQRTVEVIQALACRMIGLGWEGEMTVWAVLVLHFGKMMKSTLDGREEVRSNLSLCWTLQRSHTEGWTQSMATDSSLFAHECLLA